MLLVTDGLQTIAVFIYDDIQWGAGAQIGFNAGEGHTYYMLPEAFTSLTLNMSERSNVDQPGVFVFRIDSKQVMGIFRGSRDSYIKCSSHFRQYC